LLIALRAGVSAASTTAEVADCALIEQAPVPASFPDAFDTVWHA
jgi:hypothetical protein